MRLKKTRKTGGNQTPPLTPSEIPRRYRDGRNGVYPYFRFTEQQVLADGQLYIRILCMKCGFKGYNGNKVWKVRELFKGMNDNDTIIFLCNRCKRIDVLKDEIWTLERNLGQKKKELEGLEKSSSWG